MKAFTSLVALAAVAAIPATAYAEATQSVRDASETVAAPVQVNAGMMLYSTAGYRVAPIYRVTADGSPQLILNGRLVTVPASSLSEAEGKVMTSLTKAEIANAK